MLRVNSNALFHKMDNDLEVWRSHTMFDISFTGEVVRDEENGETLHLGIVTLGQTKEEFDASLSFWSEGEYEKQWLEGAKRLLEPDSRSAFITDVTNPTTASFIQWWPAWRVNDLIVFHCQTRMPLR